MVKLILYIFNSKTNLMKSIIIKTLPYLIAFFVINVIFYKSSRFYKQERKYIDRIEHSINVKSNVIFLGDSHLETIELLDLSENIGNLAFGADGIKEMYIKVLTMINYNPNLEYVFITTEPQIFNNSVSSNSTFLNKYLIKLDDTINIYKKSKLNIITEKIPLFNDNFLDYILNNIYSSLRSKQNVRTKEWSDLTKIQRTEIATQTGKQDHVSIMTNQDQLEIYWAIINICKFNNLKVVGIRFPVNEHYIDQCEKEDIKRVDKFIEDLNLDYHLDYLTEFANPEYFNDADHLNKEGLKKLSEIIFRDTNIKLTN